jgi:hypothetical protein
VSFGRIWYAVSAFYQSISDYSEQCIWGRFLAKLRKFPRKEKYFCLLVAGVFIFVEELSQKAVCADVHQLAQVGAEGVSVFLQETARVVENNPSEMLETE